MVTTLRGLLTYVLCSYPDVLTDCELHEAIQLLLTVHGRQVACGLRRHVLTISGVLSFPSLEIPTPTHVFSLTPAHRVRHECVQAVVWIVNRDAGG